MSVAKLDFGLRAAMVALNESAPELPKGVKGIALSYYFAPEPKELFGKVRFQQYQLECLQLFIDFNKVDSLFKQLVEFGKEFGVEEFTNEQIRTLAQTRYNCLEQLRYKRHEPLSLEVNYLDHSMHPERSAGFAMWSFAIAENVKLYLEPSLRGPADEPVMRQITSIQQLLTRLSIGPEITRRVDMSLQEVDEYAVSHSAIPGNVVSILKREKEDLKCRRRSLFAVGVAASSFYWVPKLVAAFSHNLQE